ncbi:MAG: NAD(P)H-quinone oxidoreductase subunit 3 [Candidatus Marinimicrobia bacterium]|nr:NAD(P)H-quinone oxidoreductase subunit 3 [Candidatus Neomarinimicrobiota bacterium]
MNSVSYLPFLVYIAGVLIVVGFMVGVTYFLGNRHKDRETDLPYESGIQSTGDARVRFSAKFYLVAMLFVIFDLEVVFIFAWAIAGKDLGWTGYGVVGVFVVILVIGLIYEWRVGALDWISTDRKYIRMKEVQK